MKKVGIILFLLTLAVGLVMANLSSFGRLSGKMFNLSLNVGGVKGSGISASETRDLSGFHALEVGGVFEVQVTANKEFGVVVEADDNLLPLISTEVRNGVLCIKTDRKLSTGNPVRVRVSAPDIESLDVSGAANVSIENISNGGLNVDASGASKVKVAGETSKLVVDVSGATKVDAKGLTSENATVDASGASHVAVQVTGVLRADASGASSVEYAGTPTQVMKKTSGAARVSSN